MKVYVLEYFPISISDYNGIFSTYEKAKKAYEEDVERCKDVWVNIKESKIGDSFYSAWEFRGESAQAFIYETEIDIRSA